MAACAGAWIGVGAPLAVADSGGNAAAAHTCDHGGFSSLFAQDGSTFANAGQCTSYAAHGGELAGAIMVSQPASGGSFSFSFSGFGLEPSSLAVTCTVYSGGGHCVAGYVGSDGTVAYSGSSPCTGSGAYSWVTATTAAGANLYEQFPVPPGC